MRPVLAVLVPRRKLVEPDDLEVELLPVRRAEVNPSVVPERLLASLHGVTARGHGRVAELDREPRPREALPARRLRLHVRQTNRAAAEEALEWPACSPMRAGYQVNLR